MSTRTECGAIEHCLAQGEFAEMLLRRFRQVVPAEQMAPVHFWFDELHEKAERILRQGHELVDLGIENQGAGNARPFLRFNPTRWIGSRRILLAASSTFNPRIRVAIGGQSVSIGPEAQPADAATREIRVRTGAERTRRLTTVTSQ